MNYTETFAFIDNARKLELESIAIGDMHTAAILAGIADSEEWHVQNDIMNELEDLLYGNHWDVA